ncbi:MAG: hypothetical protein V4793_32390, partial [Paraburkholderia tropica]
RRIPVVLPRFFLNALHARSPHAFIPVDARNTGLYRADERARLVVSFFCRLPACRLRVTCAPLMKRACVNSPLRVRPGPFLA